MLRDSKAVAGLLCLEIGPDDRGTAQPEHLSGNADYVMKGSPNLNANTPSPSLAENSPSRRVRDQLVSRFKPHLRPDVDYVVPYGRLCYV